MASLRLYFFSLTLETVDQLALFEDLSYLNTDRPELLKIMLEEAAVISTQRSQQIVLPEPESLDAGKTWRILDLNEVEGGEIFQIGRIAGRETPAITPTRFTKEMKLVTPYTWACIFFDLGLLVVVEDRELSRVQTSANRLADLLRETDALRRSGKRLAVRPMKDAASLVQEIERAYRILRVRLTLGRPNPPRAMETIIQPVKKAVEDINAQRARIEFEGRQMNRLTLIDLVQDVSLGTGEDVEVKIQDKKGANPRWAFLSKRSNLHREIEEPPEENEEVIGGIMTDALQLFEHVASLAQRGADGTA